MNTEKTKRKVKSETTDMDRLNRGDMIRKQKHEPPSPEPHDRGDVRRNKKLSKQELFKTTKPKKAKSLKISADLVSRSTNTFAESVPICFENPYKINMDFSPDRSVDYRKRIKDRYTFRRYQQEPQAPERRNQIRKDDDVRKVNYVLQYDVKHELPRQTHFESLDRKRSRESREVKKSERIKDRDSVHKAISAMKMKPIIKSTKDDSADRKKPESPEREKNRDCTRKNSTRYRKPVIKTITSKVDKARVYKAVTFVEHKQRKSLQIKIPTKDVPLKPKTPSKSKIPRLVSVSMPCRTEAQTPSQVKRRTNDGQKKRVVKRADTRKSPSSKSIDSLPTEVAKWAPESVDKHTMPYYEAWVNKTLTAISKYSKKDKAYLEKSKVLQALKELEMRKLSPELVYERFADEKYAGRIRIRQKPPKKEKM